MDEPMSVVIVDDSATVRNRIVRLLSEVKSAKIVGQAESARQAISMIKQMHPQVVILDLYMPGESGLVVLENFRNLAERPQFIVFTNYASPQYRRKCLEAGANFVLDKSNDFEHLPEVVASLSETKGKENRRRSMGAVAYNRRENTTEGTAGASQTDQVEKDTKSNEN